ncbi:MAG: hypothetical protein HRU77_01475 [Gammaproteobacteria bacterium]|nr:MAG: hypothetical protein HRU77_01475 [Gammaproteobacteria bacterium]
MQLSDFNPIKNTSGLIAGESLTFKDLVYLDATDGKGRKAAIANFAAVGNVDLGTQQTNDSTGMIIAQTNVSSAVTAAFSRQAVVNNENGEIFTLSNPFLLNKFSANGSLVNSVSISALAFTNDHILKLSNGNIACIGKDASSIQIAVFDANLVTVKALTAITASNNTYFSAVALSGGGFAVVFQDSSSPLNSKLATFDNSGNAVLSPTTIWTRTGASGNQYHKMIQLSNGNLAIAVSSVNTSSSIGLYYGVVTTAGVSVLSFTSLDTTSVSIFPEMAIMNGYFAISRPNGTNQKAYVFNNSGVLQGSEFTFASTAGSGNSNITKLLSDGTDFWLIWHRNTDSKCVTSKLPVTGTGGTTTITTISPSQYGLYLDAFYENGLICAISMSGSSALSPVMWVISTKTGSLLASSDTKFGVAPSTTNGFYPRVIPGGDRSFIAMYDYTNSGATNLCVGKYARTAIIGAAQNSVAADAAVRMYSEAGAYEINPIGGVATGFNHAANPITGNAGAILPLSVTLKGVGG